MDAKPCSDAETWRAFTGPVTGNISITMLMSGSSDVGACGTNNPKGQNPY